MDDRSETSSHPERIGRYRMVSSRLESLRDQDVVNLVNAATPIGAGIGGTTASMIVDDIPVFVKKVPLTDLERRRGNVASTVNLFDLPMSYQYGLGSTGFGAWREVSALRLVTQWILENRFHQAPMLYHWRVLPFAPPTREPEELRQVVAQWDESPAVRARLTAINEATASVVLFSEHIPYTVDGWLRERAAEPDPVAAYAVIEAEVLGAVAFLGSQGIAHFDAHFQNLLTDGHRVYFSDFGLAMSDEFDLSAEESAFLIQHATYDRCFTATQLVRTVVRDLRGIAWNDADAYLRAGAARGYTDLPTAAANLVRRHAPVAMVMGDFHRALRENTSTPYPADAFERAIAG